MLSGPLTLKSSGQSNTPTGSIKAEVAAPLGLAERLQSAERCEGLIKLLTAFGAAPLVYER